MITILPFNILLPPIAAGVGVKSDTQDRKKQEKRKNVKEDIFENILENEIDKIKKETKNDDAD